MKLKTTKRALGLSVLSLVLCFAMLIGTTFAWFTDSVTSENNIIHSGILRISMQWANGTEDPDAEATEWTDASTGAIFNYELWEPGYTDVKHIRIMNKDEDGVQSNLALQYKLSIVPTGTPSELAEVIDVYSVAPTADSDLQNMATQIETRDDMSKLTKLGTLQDILDDNGQIDISGIMLPTDTVNSLTIALKMQEEAGNEYQDLAIGSDFRIVLTATQYTYESDSFDNQYDAQEEEPEDYAFWYDMDAVTEFAHADEPISAADLEIEIITFTNQPITESDYDLTWDAPLNTTAHYDIGNSTLVYTFTGDKLHFTDKTMFRLGKPMLSEKQKVEIINEYIVGKYYLTEPVSSSDEALQVFKEVFDDYAAEFLDTVVSAPYMFGDTVTTLNGLEYFDVSQVTDFGSVFFGTSLEEIDISSWDTSKATNMAFLFDSCDAKTITLGDKWSTANVTNMYAMFGGCSELTALDFDKFDTAKVTNMESMFQDCEKLEGLENVSKWNVSNVQNMNMMFSNCKKMPALDLSAWNTSKVTAMKRLFNGCSAMTSLDISSWNTSEVTDMTMMFNNCSELAHIYVGSGWSTAKVTDSKEMFIGASQLPNFDNTDLYQTASHAHTGTGGYLETKH